MAMFLSCEANDVGTDVRCAPTEPPTEHDVAGAAPKDLASLTADASPRTGLTSDLSPLEAQGVDHRASQDAAQVGSQGGPPDPSTTQWRDAVIALLPPLRAFAWSLSRNSADADDLVQDTLIKAWTHKDKFEPGTNLRAWLFTILRNTYYTSVVKRRREVADEDGKHAARLSTAPTQDWSVAMKAMQAALQRLPPEHREALILVGAAGLTYEEAAEICGCALGTIKSRVNRARTRLLRIMDAEDAGDALVGVVEPPLSQAP
jgi:RNA polymerase sigma-70 factor (ECF subfamily)